MLPDAIEADVDSLGDLQAKGLRVTDAPYDAIRGWPMQQSA